MDAVNTEELLICIDRTKKVLSLGNMNPYYPSKSIWVKELSKKIKEMEKILVTTKKRQNV